MNHPATAPSIAPLFTARAVYDLRRWRDANTPGDYFGEPAWDMLLRLKIAEDDGTAIGAGALVVGLGEEAAMARHLDRLVADGLVARGADDACTLTGAGARFMATLLVAEPA